MTGFAVGDLVRVLDHPNLFRAGFPWHDTIGEIGRIAQSSPDGCTVQIDGRDALHFYNDEIEPISALEQLALEAE